jgi:pimeloyl-ACP methyl ester carboxylesterase
VRRDQKIGFIKDWWNAVTPVVDYLQTRPDVDVDKLALVGISYGGSLAPIAASHEHRFKAVIAIDGIYNLGKKVETQFPPEIMKLFSSGNRTAFDAAMNEIRTNTSTSSVTRWVIDQGLFSFNTTSPFDWMTRFSALGIEGLTDTIQGPVFIGSGQDDDITAGQPEMLADALGNRSHYVLFKTDVGAGEHAQIGADSHLAQTTFDWVAKYFE